MSHSTILTGQYVHIKQIPASVGERVFAQFVDIIIIILYEYCVYNILSYFDLVITGTYVEFTLIVILYIVPVLFYHLLFEIFNNGQSPGKMFMGMKVVMLDGSTPTISSYILRWMLFFIDFYITLGSLGVLFILLSKNRQRLGDLAAGTIVVKPNSWKNINVSLNEYSYLRENYKPIYPEAADLSYEQVSIIEKVLLNEGDTRYEYIQKLVDKVKESLKITTQQNNIDFLTTILHDYQYYAFIEN